MPAKKPERVEGTQDSQRCLMGKLSLRPGVVSECGNLTRGWEFPEAQSRALTVGVLLGPWMTLQLRSSKNIGQKYWVGQKVRSGFSVRCYRKI